MAVLFFTSRVLVVDLSITEAFTKSESNAKSCQAERDFLNYLLCTMPTQLQRSRQEVCHSDHAEWLVLRGQLTG